MSKRRLSSLIIFSLIGVFFYLPILLILVQAFIGKTAWINLWQLLGSGVFRNTLIFSCSEALLSAVFSLLIALPGAYFFGRFDFPGKRLLRSWLAIPFMLPGILVVLGLIIFYGKNGAFTLWLTGIFPGLAEINYLYSFWGIVLANVLYNFAFCLRLLGERWEKIDPRLSEASALHGASAWETWRRIVWPLLRPTAVYLLAMVFLYSFLSFTVVLILGGYLYKTFEVLIYIETNSKLNFSGATAIAGLQMILLAALLFLQSLVSRNAPPAARFQAALPRLRWRTHSGATLAFLAYLAVVTGFFMGPLLAVIARSFYRANSSGLTLANYLSLWGDGFTFAIGKSFKEVLATSLGLALTAAVATTGGAYGFAWLRRKEPWGLLDLACQLPLGVSFLTFATGLYRLAGTILPSAALIVWAQVFLAFPLVYSVLRTARRELGQAVLDASALLGADPWRTFVRVELPLMRKALQTGFTYAFAIALGDFSAVLVLGRGDLVTLPVAIYRLIGHYHFPEATALGTLFILLSLILYFGFQGRSASFASMPRKEST